MTASKEERLRKVARIIDPLWATLCERYTSKGVPYAQAALTADSSYSVEHQIALSKAASIDLLYAEEIGRLRAAADERDHLLTHIRECRLADGHAARTGEELRRDRAFDALCRAEAHVLRLVSDRVATKARAEVEALSRGLDDEGNGASNASDAGTRDHGLAPTDAEPPGAREP